MAHIAPEITLSAPSFPFHDGHGDSLIVLLAGFGAESDEFFEPVRSNLLRHGDVLAVNYGQDFDPEIIVAHTVDKIKQLAASYRRIILIGASMGGKLGWEIWQQLDPTITRLLLMETPLDRHDLPLFQRIVACINRLLPRWCNALAVNMAFGMPDISRLNLTDDQSDKIKASVANARGRNTIRRMAQQASYLKRTNLHITEAEKRASYRRVAGVSSTNGADVVLPRWLGSWEKFFRIEHLASRRLDHFLVPGKHVAFDQYRDNFGPVLESALTVLANAA